MTSIQLLAPMNAEIHSSSCYKLRRPFKTRWHYGPGYVVIAAIAPLLLLGLLIVHLHSLGLSWSNAWNNRMRAKS